VYHLSDRADANMESPKAKVTRLNFVFPKTGMTFKASNALLHTSCLNSCLDQLVLRMRSETKQNALSMLRGETL
jgi:hypothetical protein